MRIVSSGLIDAAGCFQSGDVLGLNDQYLLNEVVKICCGTDEQGVRLSEIFLTFQENNQLGLLRILLQKVQQSTEFEPLLQLLQHVLLLLEQGHDVASFIEERAEVETWDSLVDALLKMNTSSLQSFDESALRTAFTVPSKMVSYPILQEQFDNLLPILSNTYALINERRDWSSQKLAAAFEEVKKASEFDYAIVLSFGFLGLQKLVGLTPYSTQLVSILQLLHPKTHCKGQIAQVRTGEGKSLIVALTAFILATQGRRVDIISSSPYLAKRDQKKYASFFELFGITTSHISEQLPPVERFDSQIVYGTNYDFEFAFLRAWLPSEGHKDTGQCGVLKRGRDCALVDEADNLFVDISMNSARIAIPKQKQQDRIWHIFLNSVRSIFEGNSTEENFLKEFSMSIPPQTLLSWTYSAKRALYDLQEGVDYVIEPETKSNKGEDKLSSRIVIIDKDHTGRKKNASRWQNGLHQFIECKHGLIPENETLMPVSISHSVYFSEYKNLYGLTGTMGDPCEREEIHALYGISSFDVPPHRPFAGVQFPTSITDTFAEYYELLVYTAHQVNQKGQPLLFLFSSIEESEYCFQLFTSKGIRSCLLHDNQEENEDHIIRSAGKPGTITIATNTAGRGTDIILNSEAIQKAGLYLVVGFYPDNDRVLFQAFGRTARQGQPGSYQLILCREERSVERLISKDDPEFSLEKLENARNCQIKHLSSMRLIYAQRETQRHQELNTFISRLHAWKEHVSEIWIEEESKRLANTSEGDELREKMKEKWTSSPELQYQFLQNTNSSIVWTSLLTAAKEKFIVAIIEDWAIQVYEEIDSLHNQSVAAQGIFPSFWNKWEQALSNPKSLHSFL